MSSSRETATARFVAPVIGAAAGAVAVTVAVERFGVKRPIAAFGSAALALIAAHNSKGSVRRAFEAAAVAGVCLGVADVLRQMRAVATNGRQSAAPSPRQAAPPANAITQADVQVALKTVEEKHQADVVKREESHRATIHALLADLRNTQSKRETLRVVKPPIVQLPRAETADLQITPAIIEHKSAIYALLDADERRRWSTMVATIPKEQLAEIEHELMRSTPADGVAFLRSSVFRTPVRLPS